MKLSDGVNEFGTPITNFKCDYCGSKFSVCPAIEDKHLDSFKGCTIHPCESYDPKRDIDILFMDKKELQDHTEKTGIVDIEVLQKRKKHQAGEEVLKKDEIIIRKI